MTEILDKEQWDVIAYVGPQITSKGDRLVHLYPEIRGGAKWSCAIVYEEKFDMLPYGLGEQLMRAEIIAGSAPEMAVAKTQGILQSCAPFSIQTYNKADGSKTKNIASIGAPDSKQISASSVPAGRAHQPVAEELEYLSIPLDVVSQQAREIAEETIAKMQVAVHYYASTYDFMDMVKDDAIKVAVFNAMWRDINDQYRIVRPALLTVPEKSESSQYAPDGGVILNGARGDFLDDVANQHPSIENAEHTKIICELLDITGSSEEAGYRVVQAEQIWLYATLVNKPYSLDDESSVAFALSAIQADEIPF